MSVAESIGQATAAEAESAAESSQPVGHGKHRVKEGLLAAAFLLPSTVIFVAFFYLPFFRLFSYGLYRNNASGTNQRYVGIHQYRQVLTEPRLHRRPRQQRQIRAVHRSRRTHPRHAPRGHREPKLRGIKFFQTVFSSTVATSVAVASVIFYVLINPQVGVFHVDWLANPHLALLRGIAVVGVAEPRTLVRHRAGRSASHPRGGARSGDARRLRPGPALLPRHACRCCLRS